ncbi:MAG: hypothetical protein COC15_03130, partial [Legionellales bacterium]
LGYVVPFDILNTALKKIENCNARYYGLETIQQAILQDNSWQIQLTNSNITAKLLVGADGADSIVRKLANIAATTVDYKQSAIISNIQIENNHKNTAYERFVANGAIAMLPFGNANTMKFVWSLDTNKAEKLLTYNDHDFLRLVQNEFGNKLGNLQDIGKRMLLPLKCTVATQLVGNRAVLIGNAANAMHPIAAQGLNLGLRDVASLAELLHNSFDAGDSELLNKYAAWRYDDHKIINKLTHILTKDFRGRDSMMTMLDLIPSAKKYFTKRACGLNNNLPKLSLGIAL